MVGRHRFTGLRLTDGKSAWAAAPFVAIPAGGMPSGRGFADGQHYFLPTTDPELLEIDFRTGALQRHSMDDRLGNLIACRSSIISQTPSTLTRLSQHQQQRTPADPQPHAEPPIDLEQQSTDSLLQMLEHPRYRHREAASRQLMLLGTDVLDALVAAAANGSREVEYRVVTLLLRHLTSSDTETVIAARLALAELASQGGFAASAMRNEFRERETSARNELARLGATISTDGKTITLGRKWQGSVEDLDHLTWQRKVTTLVLRHPKIADDGLRRIRGLTELETLNLHRAKITSSGIAHLQDLPKLRILLLQGTGVDDDAVRHLVKIKHLRALNLQGTNVSTAGIARLKIAKPNLRIFH